MTGGTWNLEKAIVARWKAAGLDDQFRAYWVDQGASNRQPTALHDTEARPVPPGPYCVFEVGPGDKLHADAGKDKDTYIQTDEIPYQFAVHAKGTSNETGKQIAQKLADKVAEAYNDQALAVDGGSHFVGKPRRLPDFHTREGDEEWVWVVRYEGKIEHEFTTNPS